MMPIGQAAVNLSFECLTKADMASMLMSVGNSWIAVAQQFAILALLIGFGFGFWIGMNWGKRK